MDDRRYGGIEAGGTKFVCTVGNAAGEVYEHVQIPTSSPAQTMEQVVGFFKNHSAVHAIGVGSFGPVDLDRVSSTYGHILNSPKQAWINYDLLAPLKTVTANLYLDTDVDCAAMGEQAYGAGRGQDDFIYLTVGTGIGGSCIVKHTLLKGVTHPEIGHMFVPYVPGDQNFAGVCPYHGNCLEGLASGSAMQKRWGASPESLPSEHQAWDLEAQYLACGVYNLITAMMPQRIILGGGVMGNEGLLGRIQKQVQALTGNYIAIEELAGPIADYIVRPQLGELSAAKGAMHMAALVL